MFVPTLAHKPSGELGHPAYQHPQRLREGIYSAEIDRFPLLVVYCAIRALMVGGRTLWERYDNGDNLLFREEDLRSPRDSRLFWDLLRLNDAGVRRFADCLARAVYKPLDQTPLLEEMIAVSPAPRATAVAESDGDVSETPARSAERNWAMAPPPVRAASHQPMKSPSVEPKVFGEEGVRATDRIVPDQVAEVAAPVRGPLPRLLLSRPTRPNAGKTFTFVAVAALAALCIPLGVLAVIRYSGSRDKMRPAERTNNGLSNFATKMPAVKTTIPKSASASIDLRIIVDIDGRDELTITATETRWTHFSWVCPTRVQMNKLEWNPQTVPVLKNVGIAQLFGTQADLSKARLTKVRGRGPVTLRPGTDRIAIVFDDEGPPGADTYEVVVNFEK